MIDVRVVMGAALRCISVVAMRLIASRFDVFEIGAGTDLFPWRIRGGSRCHLSIGDGSVVRTRLVFEREKAIISVGSRCFLGTGLISAAEGIEIGNDVMISWGVTITDHNSHSIRCSERQRDVADWIAKGKDWTGVKVGKVFIRDRAWIGFNAILLKGVTVGEGGIVGAGSVVSKDVPPFTIVAGNPARVVRELGPDER